MGGFQILGCTWILNSLTCILHYILENARIIEGLLEYICSLFQILTKIIIS